MQLTNLAIMAAALPAVLGTPLMARDTAVTTIQLVPQATAPDHSELAHKPARLSTDATAFLSKYQTYSNKASDIIGPNKWSEVSAAGWCYQETPCSNVYRAAVIALPATSGAPIQALSPRQVSRLLDSITATSSITYSGFNQDLVYSELKDIPGVEAFGGHKINVGGAVLETFAPKGIVESTLVAGMVVDAYKSSIGTSGNANAVQALDAQRDFTMGICLYPEGVKPAAARNFCVGKEFDESVTRGGVRRRFLFDFIWDLFSPEEDDE